MLKVLIVDDEFQGRNFLMKVLAHLDSGVEIVGEAAYIADAVQIIKEKSPDLVFLDVIMKNESGFDLFQKISPVNFDVVFTTAHNEFAVRAFKVNAIDYLLKPIDLDELQLAIEKVREKKKPNAHAKNNLNIAGLLDMIRQGSVLDKIAIPSANGLEMVPTQNIIMCESDGNYTNFYLTDNRKLISSYTLKHYAEVLSEPQFYRVHKSHLVNLNHVIRYTKGDGGTIMLTGGAEVEVSKRSKEGLLKILKGKGK